MAKKKKVAARKAPTKKAVAKQPVPKKAVAPRTPAPPPPAPPKPKPRKVKPAPVPEINYRQRYENLVRAIKGAQGPGRAQDYLRSLRDMVS